METSPNSREGIEGTAPWWNNLEEALLRQDKYHFCKVDTTDLKFAIDHYRRFPQELQKAREEEREETREILRCISRMVEINATNLENYILGQMPIVQSELDQPNNNL